MNVIVFDFLKEKFLVCYTCYEENIPSEEIEDAMFSYMDNVYNGESYKTVVSNVMNSFDSISWINCGSFDLMTYMQI